MISCSAVVVAAALVSQAPGATLSGIVRDARSGEPVAGVLITLPDAARAATSAADGQYSLPGVPAGLQHLEIHRIGYADRTLHAFVPPVGRLQIHISLEPEPVRLDAIVATGHIPVRGADSADQEPPADVRLSAAAIRNHPTLAEPDALSALSGGVVAMDPEMPRGLHVRGGRADQVSYVLDGMPVLSPFHSLGLFGAWNPDALESLQLESDAASAAVPEALSGVVAAQTRAPGDRMHVQGAASTSHLRATLDGPLHGSGRAFLVSVRHGFPGFPSPQNEYSYVGGGSVDWLAKLEGSAGGGRLAFTGYGNRNRTGAPSAVVDGDDAAGQVEHRFQWGGESIGGSWSRGLSESRRVVVRAWYSAAKAAALWVDDSVEPLRVDSRRRNAGAAAALELDHRGARTSVRLRLVDQHSSFAAGHGAVDPPFGADHGVFAASIEHARSLGSTLRVRAALLGTLYRRAPYLSTGLDLRWTPRSALSMALQLGRSHQTEQSLANDESLAGYLFPPLLTVAAGADAAPVARSDRVSWTVELRPGAGTRVAAELYARSLRAIALVGPGTEQPFATTPVEFGNGTATGGAIELALARARYVVAGTYGYDRVRLETAAGTYVPGWSIAQRAEIGMLAFPVSTLSLRMAAAGEFGRRGTALRGRFEWEACNVADMGCEFAGTPAQRAEPLGGTRLPAYLRLDVGARKHWHVEVAGVEAELGLHATITNILGRRNVLTRSVDPATGEWAWVEMRSRAPLAIGVDWRF